MCIILISQKQTSGNCTPIKEKVNKVFHIIYEYIKIEDYSFLDKTFSIFFPCGFSEMLVNSFYVNHFNEG